MGGFSTAVMPPSNAALDLRPPQSTDPLATLAQMGQLQEQRQALQQRAALAPIQQQTAQLQQQQLSMDIEQRKAMNAAFQQAYEPDANGGMTLNPGKVMQSLATSGSGAAIPEVGQHLAALQKSYADLADTKLKIAGLEADAAGRIGAIVKAAGNDPAMFHSLITDAVTQKHLEPGHATALDQAVTQTYQQDPSGQAARALVGQISEQFIAGSPQQQELAAKAAESKKNIAQAGEFAASEAQKKVETERTQRQLAALKDPNTLANLEKQIDSTIPVAKGGIYADENNMAKQAVRNILATGEPTALDKAQAAIKDSADRIGRYEAGVAQAHATVGAKVEVVQGTEAAKMAASGATEDDFQRAGEQYARTGIMPPLGMTQTARLKVAHYAQQWARDNGLSPSDLVGIQAAYKGDVGSMVNLQKQRDQIVSFEQTAQKNLDLMLEKAKPLLDVGSPLLNKPLRSIDRTVLGGTDQAAFDAARLVAGNEIAKVTSGGGMGTVLSDSAKKEVEKAMNPNATLGQIVAAANVMRQDMANRHGSMDATLGDIRSRMTGQPAAPAAAPAQPMAQQPAGASGQLPRPANKAERDKLPVGTRYMDAEGNIATRR